jgi:hypothetical protein
MANHWISTTPDLIAAVADEAGVRPGDVINLPPGTYSPGVLTLTRPLSIRADTPDPVGEPCVLSSGSRIYCDWSESAAAAVPEMHIEGLRFGPYSGSQGFVHFATNLPVPAGFTLYLTKCWLLGAFGGSSGYNGYPLGGYPQPMTVWLRNCELSSGYGGGEWAPHNQAGPGAGVVVRLESVQSKSAFNTPSPAPTIALNDVVTAPTEGYGPEYGSGRYPWPAVGNFRLAGTELLESDEPRDAVQIILYRETEYGSQVIESRAWLETRPDPVTGEWVFDFLPALDRNGNPQRYAIAINPPGCYGGELLRWYTPEQGES